MTGETVVPARRARHRPGWVAPGVVALAVLAAAGFGIRAQATDGVGSQTGVRALIVSGSSLSYADAQRTASELGWQASVYTLPGAGISRSNLDPAKSITRTARMVLPSPASPPDIVVIQGGEADNASSPAVLERATQHLIDYVQAHAGPQAELVLVGPIPAQTAPASMAAVNDVLRSAAEQRGVVFIDALERGWWAGDPGLSGALATALDGAVQTGE